MAADAVLSPTGFSAYRRNLAELTSHQKAKRGAPPYSLLVNRPLGRRIAALAHVIGLSPNQISMLSAAVSASGLVTIAWARPTAMSATAAVFLLLLGYAIDSADGQLARLTSGGTLAGEWLDHCLDMVKMASFHAVILVSAYRFGADLGTWPMITAVVFGVVAVSSFFVLILTDQLRRQAGGSGPARPSSAGFLLLAAPTDYGVQCLWLLALPWETVFFAGYLLLAVANLGYLAVGSVSRFRQLVALDTERAGGSPGATS